MPKTRTSTKAKAELKAELIKAKAKANFEAGFRLAHDDAHPKREPLIFARGVYLIDSEWGRRVLAGIARVCGDELAYNYYSEKARTFVQPTHWLTRKGFLARNPHHVGYMKALRFGWLRRQKKWVLEYMAAGEQMRADSRGGRI